MKALIWLLAVPGLFLLYLWFQARVDAALKWIAHQDREICSSWRNAIRFSGMLWLGLLVLLPLPGWALSSPTNTASVTLTWDASLDDGRTNDCFYRVYAGFSPAIATNVMASLTNAYAGTNLVITLTNLATGQWNFVVTAYRGGMESAPSPVLGFTVYPTAPRPPGRLAQVFIDTSVDMVNWTERGFFRARIGLPP